MILVIVRPITTSPVDRGTLPSQREEMEPMEVNIEDTRNDYVVPNSLTLNQENFPPLRQVQGTGNSRQMGETRSNPKIGASNINPGMVHTEDENDKELRLMVKLEGIMEGLLDQKLGCPVLSYAETKKNKQRIEEAKQSKAAPPLGYNSATKEGKNKRTNKDSSNRVTTTLNPPANPGKNVNAHKSTDKARVKVKLHDTVAITGKEQTPRPQASSSKEQSPSRGETWVQVVGRKNRRSTNANADQVKNDKLQEGRKAPNNNDNKGQNPNQEKAGKLPKTRREPKSCGHGYMPSRHLC